MIRLDPHLLILLDFQLGQRNSSNSQELKAVFHKRMRRKQLGQANMYVHGVEKSLLCIMSTKQQSKAESLEQIMGSRRERVKPPP